jgi:hypothetical protein
MTNPLDLKEIRKTCYWVDYNGTRYAVHDGRRGGKIVATCPTHADAANVCTALNATFIEHADPRRHP